MITVRELIIKRLNELGADGLCNRDESCGCGDDDLGPCDCLNLDQCEPAKFICPEPNDPDFWDEYPEGFYKALEALKPCAD